MTPTATADSRTYDVSPSADPAILAPVAEHEDLREIVHAIVTKSDNAWHRLMSELEIGSLAIPESHGGAGCGLRELGIVLEETGGALLPDPIATSAVVAVQALLAAGEPARELLDAVSSGRQIATVAWSGSSDLTAAPSNGSWLVDGSVRNVLQVAGANHLIVSASTDAGHALFALELPQESITVQPRRVLDETRPVGDLTMTNATAMLLVGPDEFADAWSRVTTAAAIAVAAEHTGVAAHLLETTTAYLLERQQFGRAIASFQAIKHRLADLLVDLERARSASRYAAAVFDQDPAEAVLAARVAAAVCQDAVIRAAHESVQLHGGIGFTWEHPAHLYVRRALGDEGLFGSSRAHRAAVADLVGL